MFKVHVEGFSIKMKQHHLQFHSDNLSFPFYLRPSKRDSLSSIEYVYLGKFIKKIQVHKKKIDENFTEYWGEDTNFSHFFSEKGTKFGRISPNVKPYILWWWWQKKIDRLHKHWTLNIETCKECLLMATVANWREAVCHLHVKDFDADLHAASFRIQVHMSSI